MYNKIIILIFTSLLSGCTYFDKNDIGPLKTVDFGTFEILNFNTNHIKSEKGIKYPFLVYGYNFPINKGDVKVWINDKLCEIYKVAPTNYIKGNIDTLGCYLENGSKSGKIKIEFNGKSYFSPNEMVVVELDETSELSDITGFPLTTEFYIGQSVAITKDSVYEIQIPIFHKGTKGDTEINFAFYSGETKLFPEKSFKTLLTGWDKSSGYVRVFLGTSEVLKDLKFPRQFEIRAYLSKPTEGSIWYWSGGENINSNLTNSTNKLNKNYPNFQYGFKIYTF